MEYVSAEVKMQKHRQKSSKKGKAFHKVAAFDFHKFGHISLKHFSSYKEGKYIILHQAQEVIKLHVMPLCIVGIECSGSIGKWELSYSDDFPHKA